MFFTAMHRKKTASGRFGGLHGAKNVLSYLDIFWKAYPEAAAVYTSLCVQSSSFGAFCKYIEFKIEREKETTHVQKF